VKNYYNMPPFEDSDNAFLRRYLQAYLACISYVDACVGRVLVALEESVAADNTIVVFMGDHGYQMGEYDSWGHKHSNFEISTRTPLLMSAPGMQARGKSTRRLIEFLDLYPTLCDLAHLPLPEHLEGKSFAHLLNTPAAAHREAACSEMNRRGLVGQSVRTAEYRYTEWRAKQGELVARELYDHRYDDERGLLETANVADLPEFKPVIQQLQKKLKEVFPR
jgi:arylsulfatase A-like enzyme